MSFCFLNWAAQATATAPTSSLWRSNPYEWVTVWFSSRPVMADFVQICAALAVAWAGLFITQRYGLKLIQYFAAKSKTTWDEKFIQHGVFARLSWVVPLMILHHGIRLLVSMPPEYGAFIHKLFIGALVIIMLRVLSAVLSAINDIYTSYTISRNRPIKGLLQIVLIIAYIFAGIYIVAVMMDESPWMFISGLGAMMALILLVFRDTLLSLVAGIQLTHNNLICVGDWIEMPQFNADGAIVDIALHTVSIRNWDNTISVIPTHKFLDNSFKNWRGMSESGGRRIKRALNIDMTSVTFLTQEQVLHLQRFDVLKDYLAKKIEDIGRFNAGKAVDSETIVNGRRLTNLGTFREYVQGYLRQNPSIHKSMTLMVRQLEPKAHGLPLEIYVFSNNTKWVDYEGIQADIFDHLLAIMPEFGLRVFQEPTGHDLTKFSAAKA